MKQSIFFYKELTPAEVGKTGTHEIYVRLPNNFDYKTFFSNSGTQNGSVIEINFMATDITDGESNLVQLRFVYFMNSNQEKRIPSLGDLFRNHKIQEGDIVCLKRSGNASNPIFCIRFYRKGTIKINPSSIYFINIDDEPILLQKSILTEKRLQQIYYGAPGTGKSKTIKDSTEEAEEEGRVFRTTFHPDSDYSTFVGCYKPSMRSTDRIYSAEELAVKLKEIKNTGVTYPCHKFAAQYWKSLKDLSANSIKEILSAAGFTEAYGVEVSKGVAIGQEYLNRGEDGKIVYTFTPQAFTNAYIKAWSTEEDVYLIIEEINRGNCAQIFGDLFQLLDRGDDGNSEYPIDADTDLGNYIAKELADSARTDFPEGVKDGKKLVLPSNLYIWATMNTSDQSLFPIDSAFKRRWDWKYIPIAQGKDKNGNLMNWQIEGQGDNSWWIFIQGINEVIDITTHSEDKKLGFFFCKANDSVVKKEAFVNKVVFYLWNDVFKVYGFKSEIFDKKDQDGKTEKITFKSFYNEDGTVNEVTMSAFVKNVMAKAPKAKVDIVNKDVSEEQSGDIETQA